tara:strand:- start:793 stop:1224 length:432 start_codon:yes stop_codon:yes gene_type:complete
MSKELKRDLEFAISRNTGTVTGNGTNTAAQMAGIESYLTSNIQYGTAAATGAVNPGFSGSGVVAPTDPTGTALVITEAKLSALIASCWENGAEPDVLISGSYNRQQISGFNGIATMYRDAGAGSGPNRLAPAAIMATADIYVN